MSSTQWTWIWAHSGRQWGQGSLMCCSSWGHKELDTTYLLNTQQWLLYNVVLISALQWSESVICIHFYPCPWISLQPGSPPHPSRSQSAELSFPRAVCFTHGSVFVLFSQLLPPPFPTVSKSPFSMSVLLFPSCNRFISTIFLDSTYMC